MLKLRPLVATPGQPVVLTAGHPFTGRLALAAGRYLPLIAPYLPFCACAAVLLTALIASSPWGDTPFQDDFSFSWMAKSIADTGHLSFNGWSEPSVGVQALFGALVIRIFGWSYEVLRLSMFAWAAGCVALLYFTARLVGLSRHSACFSALVFSLCPLVLPLESSFMTDVPATFFALLATYAAARSALDRNRSGALLWLAAGLATTLLGVSIRQSGVALLPAVALIPALLRRERVFSRCAAALGLTTAAVTFWMMHWFASQPHTYALHLLPSIIQTIEHPANAAFRLLVFAAAIVVFCLPAFSGSLARLNIKDLRFAGLALGFAAAFFALTHFWLHTLTLVPYGEIVSGHGILTSDAFIGGRPTVVPGRLIILITLLALVSFFFLLRSAARSAHHALGSTAFRAWLMIQATFVAFYFAGVIARPSAAMQPFDRYLIPMLPLFIVASMYLVRLPSPSLVQYAALIAFAVFGIAAVHDYYAERRICTYSANALMQRGVPRTEITAGFDFDSATEIQNSGVVLNGCHNDPGPIKELNGFLKCAPSIEPRFAVGLTALPGASEVPLHSYTADLWLPPFRMSTHVSSLPASDSQYRASAARTAPNSRASVVE